MFTLIGQNFINMIRSFYPEVKIASGGREVVCRCRSCGDSKDPKHAHLYISVPQTAEELSLYHCKKCSAHGIVDDEFLRRYGCLDTRVLVDINKHVSDLRKTPRYAMIHSKRIFYLNNSYVSEQPWNQSKIEYINYRIGSNFNLQDLQKLKIFLNLYDLLNQNNLDITRHQLVTDALNEHFIGFISYDNSYAIMRKSTTVELYKTVNKRYINYNIINKYDSSKDFYVIPTSVDINSPIPVNIHISEGVFDILSIYYNLNNCNDVQHIYISSSGKSYSQALEFILKETGIINYNIHVYPDNDVNEYELARLITNKISMLCGDIYIHRNSFQGEKDYGVPMYRINDSFRLIHERNV